MATSLEPAYEARRQQIREHYRKLMESDAKLRAVVDQAKPVLPVFQSVYDTLFSDLHRISHRVLTYHFRQGDWYFAEYAARDMDVWTRVHATFVTMSSYLEHEQGFALNEETRARLGSQAGGHAIRLANLNSYRNALNSIFNPQQQFSSQSLPRLTPEEVDPSLAGINADVDQNRELLRRLGITLNSTGALPDYGTPMSTIPAGGGDSSKGNYGWGGGPGDNYRKILDEQRKAAERMAQISDYMLQAVQTVRSSYNDLLSSVETLLIVTAAFAAGVLAAVSGLLKWLLLRILASVGLGPAAPAFVVASTLAAVVAVVKFVGTTLMASAALTNGWVLVYKNESTLAPAKARYLNQVETWKGDTSRLPGGRWPNPLTEVGTPEMVQGGDGYRVAWRAADRPGVGLGNALNYEGQSLDATPWWTAAPSP